ncbi:hypothetical protein TWF730_009898 [Orbilia blumenaviensis]|uniref:Uncharacterized protein n=1 Tax=Orbilia blumenaviensis TaxID=1796055 RepID=A0AAV9UVL5_9PEZI
MRLVYKVPVPLLATTVRKRILSANVRDFDCILYLLAGLFDYDDHPIKTALAPDSLDLRSIPIYRSLDTPVSRYPPEVTATLRYQHPNPDTNSLYRNFMIFNEIRIFCKARLEAELVKLQAEANAIVEHLSSRGDCKVYEARALLDLMTMSPISYTTKSIKTQVTHYSGMESPYLSALLKNQKTCGQLFLYLKTKTIPSACHTHEVAPEASLQYSDFQRAEKILHNLILTRLIGTPRQPVSENIAILLSFYRGIDPLPHRACWLKDEHLAHSLSSDRPVTALHRNLLGETEIHIARKNKLEHLAFAVSQDTSMEEITRPDIRGMDAISARFLDDGLDGISAETFNTPERLNLRRCACFLIDEVPGLKEIRNSFPGTRLGEWVRLNPYQLAALTGKLDLINILDVHESHERALQAAFSGYSIPAYKNDICRMYDFLAGRSLEPVFNLEGYQPVVLSALAGYIDITRHYLESYPPLFTGQSKGGVLQTLLLIAFKKGNLEFLKEASPFGLDVNSPIILSRQAAEIATPEAFHLWMNLAWSGLMGPVRCQLWQIILSSLRARYSNTPGVEDQAIQDEKVRFVEVVGVMRESMYLTGCGCRDCEKSYTSFCQDLNHMII